MTSIPDLLALPVTNRPEAEAFIRLLGELGLIYHFEDGAVDCLFGNGLVTEGEAAAIDTKVDACYSAWRASGADLQEDCPIGYALQVLGR
jgi:hypothetical protein